MSAAAILGHFAKIYADADACVGAAIEQGRAPIRTLGIDAPFALLRSKGFQPIRLAAVIGPTPRADAIMGSKGLGRRGRGLLEAILSPPHAGVPLLITTADAEQTQLFATLRELARLKEADLDPIYLLDLCHQNREGSRRYTDLRLREFEEWLANLRPCAKILDVVPSNASDLAALRRGAPRLAGLDMLRIAGSAGMLPPAQHAALIHDLLANTATLPSRDGPRIFLAGSLHEDDRFYAAIEALGATIVGEDHGWGERFLANGAIIPPTSELPTEVAKRIASAVEACRPTHILHLTIGDDEASPWQVAPLKALISTLPFAAISARDANADFVDNVRALLSGSAPAVRPAQAKSRPSPATGSKPRETRSRKALGSLANFGRYQREWFAEIRKRAAEGEPFAVVNANSPQEILRALDIPFVVNQWWASIVAAKQQSGRYMGLLRAHDLPAKVETYSSQGLAASFDEDPENAPWGGLPKPTILHAVRSSDATAGIFDDWATACGAQKYLYERTVDPRWSISTDWWNELPDHWDQSLEPQRIDLLVAELKDVISQLEAASGRTFDPSRFEKIMHLVNEQEDYYRRTRDLIAKTVPAPIGLADQMPATMVPQWHRGTVWARDAARAFYEEVAARVAAGEAAAPNERVRLMWVGRGLWSEMGFYQRWEESHGAVFVCSMYLSLAADGYIRSFDRGRDPLRALAARFLTMGDELRMPSWAAPWHVHEAQTHQVDGAVAVADADPFVVRALEKAGIPILDIGMDNFDREGSDVEAIDARMVAFIEGAAGAKAAARRGTTA